MSKSFDIITPHIRELIPALEDPEVSEIMVNAGGVVFIERFGVIQPTLIVIEERRLRTAVNNIFRNLGKDISEAHPILDGRLDDGSRIAAAIAPVSVGGTTLNIRKFRTEVFTATELLDRGMYSYTQLCGLSEVIADRETVLICGGAGTGKTTLLNALTEFIDPLERVVVIEDTAEIRMSDQPNVVRLEARSAQDGEKAVTIEDLLRHSLRLRPDRIIIGEIRGPEAFEWLQSVNTGHEGTLCTIHANTAAAALSRLEVCVAVANIKLPTTAIARMLAAAIDVIVHIERRNGVRRVSEVLSVGRYDVARDEYELTPWEGDDVSTQSSLTA